MFQVPGIPSTSCSLRRLVFLLLGCSFGLLTSALHLLLLAQLATVASRLGLRQQPPAFLASSHHGGIDDGTNKKAFVIAAELLIVAKSRESDFVSVERRPACIRFPLRPIENDWLACYELFRN